MAICAEARRAVEVSAICTEGDTGCTVGPDSRVGVRTHLVVSVIGEEGCGETLRAILEGRPVAHFAVLVALEADCMPVLSSVEVAYIGDSVVREDVVLCAVVDAVIVRHTHVGNTRKEVLITSTSSALFA